MCSYSNVDPLILSSHPDNYLHTFFPPISAFIPNHPSVLTLPGCRLDSDRTPASVTRRSHFWLTLILLFFFFCLTGAACRSLRCSFSLFSPPQTTHTHTRWTKLDLTAYQQTFQVLNWTVFFCSYQPFPSQHPHTLMHNYTFPSDPKRLILCILCLLVAGLAFGLILQLYRNIGNMVSLSLLWGVCWSDALLAAERSQEEAVALFWGLKHEKGLRLLGMVRDAERGWNKPRWNTHFQ